MLPRETFLMISKTVVASSIAAILLASGAAAAAEITGAVKGWDTKGQMLTLENDLAYNLPTNLQTSTEFVAIGSRVTLVFDADPADATKRLVSKISMAPVGAPRP